MRVLLAGLALCAGCVLPHVVRPTLDLGGPSEAPLPVRAVVLVTDELRREHETLARSGLIFVDAYQVATGETLTEGLAQLLRRDFSEVAVVIGDEPPVDAELTIQPYDMVMRNLYADETRFFGLETWLLVTRRGRSSVFHYAEQVAVGNVAVVSWFSDFALPPIMTSAPKELFERILSRFREELLDHLLLKRSGDEPKLRADAGDVLRVVIRHQADVRPCREEQWARGTVKHGLLEVRLTVQPSGAASNIEVTSSETAAEPIAHCVARNLSKWTFPRYELPSDWVTIPVPF